MSKILFTENKLQNIVRECVNEVLCEYGFDLLNESDGDNVLYDVMEEYSIFDLLCEFADDKEHGVAKRKWVLIPAQQYKTLLERFMLAPTPDAARIPENVVDGWFKIIVQNTVVLDYMTAIAGHEQYFPSDDLEDFFGNVTDWTDYSLAFEYLDNLGFYDWCKLPDNSDAWSDYGLKPIYTLIRQYNASMSPGEVLVLINRILDITHNRGDLASAFIEGGSKTCSQISGQMHTNSLNENISNESLGNFLGSAYQWLRNKYYNFKNDFEAGRRYQREKNKDYDPYAKYGSDAERFRNLGGQEYADYRYNLAKDRNQKADLDWENQFGTTTTSWKKPSANPDLTDNQTKKPKQTAKPKQQAKKNKTNSKNK